MKQVLFEIMQYTLVRDIELETRVERIPCYTERVENKGPTETDLREVIINEFKSLKSAFSILCFSIVN